MEHERLGRQNSRYRVEDDATYARLGARVKAGLDKGRARRLAEQKALATKNLMMIFTLVKLELEHNQPRRGLPVRVHRQFLKLGGNLSERRVRIIIAELSEPLSKTSDSRRYDASNKLEAV